MININELRRLAQAVSGWSNCNQAWLDQSGDTPAAVVGHIDEEGNTYPVATIDCDQYSAADQSLPLGKFYAAANPATVSKLLDRLEAAEKDIALKERVIDSLGLGLNAAAHERDNLRAEVESWKGLAAQFGKEADKEKTHLAFAKDELNHLRARIEAMEKQEPVGLFARIDGDGPLMECKHADISRVPLYALPGAQGEEK